MHRLDLLEEDGRRALRGIFVSGLADKTVLITGASGLVGTHFLYGLIHCQRELGLRLTVLAAIQRVVPAHLRQLERQGFARFLSGNLAETSFLESLPQADVIIHAATYGQPAMFMENPLATLKLNTTATFVLLDKLLPGGKFLFLSSSEVYSGLTNAPFTENQIGTTNPAHPRSCYIEAKRCGEAICSVYRANGIDAKSVRLSLAYGPGTRVGDKRVINSFIEQALRAKVIRLLDRGKPTEHIATSRMPFTCCGGFSWKERGSPTMSAEPQGQQSQISLKSLARCWLCPCRFRRKPTREWLARRMMFAWISPSSRTSLVPLILSVCRRA